MADLVGAAQGAQTSQIPNYAGVNIQIFNPAVNTPNSIPTAQTYNTNNNNYTSNPIAYPANYYTQNLAQPAQAAQPAAPQQAAAPEKKKMETREIVQLSDDYVKTVENYLNSQDSQIRLLGAKEVSARFSEDKSRKDDPALNALVNKMLQDPYQPVRVMAMDLLESRNATGNDESVAILQKMQQTKSADGQDELEASNALLKMSGSTTKKEFEVENKPEKTSSKKKEKAESKDSK